jgi:hypothetical protein
MFCFLTALLQLQHRALMSCAIADCYSRSCRSQIDRRNQKGRSSLKKQLFYSLAAVAATFGFLAWAPVHPLQATETKPAFEKVTPVVFQAAGPNAASIQSSVDQFRLALGGVNNGNGAGPLDTGRREINWDGGGNNPATSPGPTPFQVFLNTRGAEMTTPGTGFVQATPDGLAETFKDATLATTFAAFSPLRLFASIGSNVTDVAFFIPGTTGGVVAQTSAFGVVFSDVDKENSTRVKFFDAYGRLLYMADAPESPGTATFSFIGVQFPDARIAYVRIVSGAEVREHGPKKRDVVVMDDFIYGEPQAIQ